MKAKLCSLLLLMLATVYQARAGEPTVALIVELVDGTTQEYVIGDAPRVTFDESNVLIKSLVVETEIPKDEVERFYFDWKGQPSTAIDEVRKPADFSFNYDGCNVLLTGADGLVQVYDMSGRCLLNSRTTDGVASIDMTPFNTGVYIIKMNTQSIKILKK